MKNYFVTWEIDIEAENAEAAARKALAIQRNPDSIATVFKVHEADAQETVTIDLTLLDELK